MNRLIKKLSISQQMFTMIFICITVIMTIFMIAVTSVLQGYLVNMAVKINTDGAAYIEQSMESVFSTSEEYALLLASDSNLQQSMSRYKYNKSMMTKNEVAKMASKTFSPTYLVDNLIGAALLDTEREFVYTNSFFKGTDICSAVSPELCKKTIESSRPEWQADSVKLTEYRGPEGISYKRYTEGQERNVVFLYKVLRNVDSGEFLGYIILFVDEESFEQLYVNTNNYANSNYYLVGEDNTIISSSDRELLREEIPEKLTWMLSDQINVLQDEGKPMQYISSIIEENNSWLIQVISMDDLANQKLYLWVIAASCIMGLIFMLSFSAMKVSARVARPIIELSEVMGTIEGSADLSIRVDDKQWSGEQAVLAKGFNNLMERLQKAMDDIYHQQREKRKIEIQLLQEQINPHFLYNTLETISSLVMLNMGSRAVDLCTHLSDFYKMSLSNGNNIITLEDEFMIAENYLSIQSIRYVEYMEYNIECDSSIGDCYVPKFLVQPLIENAIYHGLKQQNRKGMLLITAQRDDVEDKIVVNVIDTGTGIEAEKLVEMNKIMESGKISPDSFGLSNVSSRLRHFFGEDGKISITSTPGIATNVQIEFPMVRTKDELYSKWRG